MSRYRPVRAGIVNLWDYTDHEFAFHGGRLVLRGANGSGKTKALELLFPFLFDASISPQRLDPFTGAGRTMRDNLLYRPDRETVTGYAWMEFACDGDARDGDTRDGDTRDGDTRVVIGAGLRGQRSRQDVTTWFFVTDRSVGDGWSLLDDDRQPLTPKALRAVVGADNVFETGVAYRQRVDDVLFGGIGADRYMSMIQLVLYLRRPQLAKDLDLGELSTTLSAGLRPVDDDLLAEGARSFDDLEAVQRDLERLEQACTTTDQFLRAYVPYVRVVGRHRADGVLHARRALRSAEMALANAHRAVDEARNNVVEAGAAVATAVAEQRRFEDERSALQRSDAYQTIAQLDDLRRLVAAAADAVGRAERDVTKTTQRWTDGQGRAETAARDADAAVAAAGSSFEELRSSATIVAPSRLADIDGLADLAEPRPVAIAVARERRVDLQAVRPLLDAFERAAAEASQAENELADAVARLDEALVAEQTANAAVDEARLALSHEITAWAGRWEWVDAEDLHALLAVGADERPALREELLARTAQRRQAIAAAVARLDDQVARLHAERERWLAERTDVAAERDDAPPSPPARRRDRSGVLGAPLWRVVDFAEHLTTGERAGLESALHAAGLLDAWIAPTGGNTTEDLDVYLRAHPIEGGDATLASLLVVDLPPHSPLDAAEVRSVLASIGVDGLGVDRLGVRVGVGVDGRFSMGPLFGQSSAPTAEFIGATARATRRVRRLAELDLAIAGVDRELEDLAGRRHEHVDTMAAFEQSMHDLPSTAVVEDATRRVDEAVATVITRRADQLRRERASTDAAARRASAMDTLGREAGHRALPDQREGLERFAEALAAFERAIERYDRDRLHQRTAAARAHDLLAEVNQQRVEVDTRRHEWDERSTEHRRLSAELATVEDTRGAEAQQLLADLARVEHDLRAAESVVDGARDHERDAAVAAARAEEAIAAADREREQSISRHADANHRVRVLRRPELRATLGLADTEDPDSFVDRLDEACAGVGASDERRQAAKTGARNAFQHLETHLGPRYHASLDDADDIDVALVADDDGVSSVATFAARITRRRDEQRTLLTAQERQVLEDTLIDHLCRQLHHRLRDGEEQVRQMNRSLAGRTTTSGKTVQLVWAANENLSEDQRQIVKLLDRDPAYIGDDRSRLRESLAHEIRAARANDPGASYHQVLAHVLDYRTWRSFGVKLRERGGDERQLSKRLFNQHSGGERATILHLPLFAAAAAHFEAAGPNCPRLIALDEAFAGIDTATTRQLLALTVDFDLDLFLTGHDFWGTYPEVPAVAIAQLSHDRDSHTVSSLAMYWDGAVLHHDS